MSNVKLLCCVSIILFGAFMVVFGGIDDSPGGQLLGLVIGIAGIVGIIRNRKVA